MILYSGVTDLLRFERPYRLRLPRHIPKDLNPQQRISKNAVSRIKFQISHQKYERKNLVTKKVNIFFFPPHIAGITMTQDEAEL